MSVKEDLMITVKEYCEAMPDLQGQNPPALLFDFVIEKFKQKRAYPDYFDENRIEKDLSQHHASLAMAVIDLYAKTGFEGQTASNENGISRTWESAYISSSIFQNIMPYVKVVSKK